MTFSSFAARNAAQVFLMHLSTPFLDMENFLEAICLLLTPCCPCWLMAERREDPWHSGGEQRSSLSSEPFPFPTGQA